MKNLVYVVHSQLVSHSKQNKITSTQTLGLGNITLVHKSQAWNTLGLFYHFQINEIVNEKVQISVAHQQEMLNFLTPNLHEDVR